MPFRLPSHVTKAGIFSSVARLARTFDESKRRRGQPGNRGQFAAGGVTGARPGVTTRQRFGDHAGAVNRRTGSPFRLPGGARAHPAAIQRLHAFVRTPKFRAMHPDEQHPYRQIAHDYLKTGRHDEAGLHAMMDAHGVPHPSAGRARPAASPPPMPSRAPAAGANLRPTDPRHNPDLDAAMGAAPPTVHQPAR